jgi:hemolysin activation/secretion protein
VPDLSGWLDGFPVLSSVAGPPLRWLSETRLVARVYGGAALPTRGEFFSLGGSELFRGFDLRERQGSVVWVGSLEWRVPVVKQVSWDVCDHIVGVRNVYAAAFYDAGDAYLGRFSYGPVAHGLGVGLRVDLAWLGFVERTIVRFDAAKTVNADTPWQFWFGFQHPF